jgi:hypothetical protein
VCLFSIYFLDKKVIYKLGTGAVAPKVMSLRTILAIVFGLVLAVGVVYLFRGAIGNAIGTGIKTVKSIALLAGGIGSAITIASVVFNIIKGTFSVTKLLGGFNIFSGQVQGKLIFYGVIIVIALAIAFGLYTKITEKTIVTNYKNKITAENVTIDERPILPEVHYLVRLEILGLDIHFFQRTQKPYNNSKTTIVQAGATTVPKEKPVKKTTKPIVKKGKK